MRFDPCLCCRAYTVAAQFGNEHCALVGGQMTPQNVSRKNFCHEIAAAVVGVLGEHGLDAEFFAGPQPMASVQQDVFRFQDWFTLAALGNVSL
jgi:hypothetical protein